MPTLNEDCHIILSHPDVNGGADYGFILAGEGAMGPGLSIQKEVGTSGTNIKVFFNVLLADDLVNPDGTKHSAGRTEMYNMLSEYLNEVEDLQLTCAIGLIANVGATGHTATETHYGPASVVACQLNNVGSYTGPVDIVALNNSVWDGTLTWDTSYWR